TPDSVNDRLCRSTHRWHPPTFTACARAWARGVVPVGLVLLCRAVGVTVLISKVLAESLRRHVLGPSRLRAMVQQVKARGEDGRFGLGEPTDGPAGGHRGHAFDHG